MGLLDLPMKVFFFCKVKKTSGYLFCISLNHTMLWYSSLFLFLQRISIRLTSEALFFVVSKFYKSEKRYRLSSHWNNWIIRKKSSFLLQLVLITSKSRISLKILSPMFLDLLYCSYQLLHSSSILYQRKRETPDDLKQQIFRY